MQQLIRTISDIYNFIECPSIPVISINLELIIQLVQVHELLQNFFKKQSNYPKQIFQQLQEYIAMQQDVFGPRKFARIIEAISTVTFQYIINLLRQGIIDKAVLCLTYFERSCSRYFTNIIKAIISIIYGMAHLKNDNFTIVQEYNGISSQILKLESKNKGDTNINNLVLISAILDSIINYSKKNYSKAKCILSEIISKVTSKIQEQKSKSGKISQQTICFFVLSTYYISKVYSRMNAMDISSYNLTQCLQFAGRYLVNSQFLINSCTESSSYLVKKRVKLSRIQNKIERIKSLHSLNSFFPTSNITNQLDKHKNIRSFKISKISQHNDIKQKKIDKQLNQLFILDENSETKLKRRTLNTLKVELRQKQKKIDEFKHQIQQFVKQRQQINSKYQNQVFQDQLKTINILKDNVKKQMFNRVWDVVQTLKPTKKIQIYINCFKNAVYYQTAIKFLRYLRNCVNLKGQLKLFCFLNRYRTHLKRQLINLIQINSVKHQIQYSVHKINKTYHINIYQIQKGTGVNEQLIVDYEVYQNLKKQPLSLYFEVVDSKLIPLVNYILTLKKSVQHRMKIFAIRLKNRLLCLKNGLYYRKQIVNINFNTYSNYLKYTVFIRSKKLADGNFSHSIERIDNFKYVNNDYNIIFRKNIINEESQLCQSQLTQLLTQQLLVNKQKHIKQIIRIQSYFRVKLSIKLMQNIKQNVSVNTTIINKNIFTFVQKQSQRYFYIENLYKKYPTVILKDINFGNISFINKLRAKLSLIDDCNVQLSIINKYFKLRQYAIKIIKKSKQATLNSKFQSKFKKSLCFAKFMDKFLYRGKYLQGKVMYMLTVKNFQNFPRPYLLRVFTVQRQQLFSINFQKIIYSSTKIFLQSNLEKINELIDVQTVKEANILLQGPPIHINNKKTKRSNQKSSILSNYTFGSGEDFIKEGSNDRSSNKMMGQGRLSRINGNKRNSINFKMRHKSALKQRDILLIKKWIEDSKEDSQISQSSQSDSN